MNTQQRKYALERVAALLAGKLQALRDELTVPAIIITDERRAELIRTGEVKLKADCTTISHYTDVIQAFDFSAFSRPSGYDEAVYAPRAAALTTEADKVRDRIMLGDTEEALALLTAFAA